MTHPFASIKTGVSDSIRMNKKRCISMIEELSNSFGPSGYEDDVLSVIRRYADELGSFSEDCLRNLYLARKENSGTQPVLMLDAHTDEVGFMVHSIRGDGTLRVVPLGGWDKFCLPSNRVLVRNALGRYIPGVIASKPYQYMEQSERNQACWDISKLAVDIGATSREDAVTKFRIRIGEPICPEGVFCYNAEHDTMYGKAFDCRLGCAALIETLDRIKGIQLPFDIMAVFSAQEELGDRGIKVAVNRIKPQIAFCFEGCPADDTFINAYDSQTALTKGPMLRYMDKSIICTPRYQRYVLDLAEQKSIPVQSAVREHGGCNASVINTACDGIPVVVAGIPVRYAHTCNCVSHYSDYESTVQLAVETLKSLSIETYMSF